MTVGAAKPDKLARPVYSDQCRMTKHTRVQIPGSWGRRLFANMARRGVKRSDTPTHVYTVVVVVVEEEDDGHNTAVQFARYDSIPKPFR